MKKKKRVRDDTRLKAESPSIWEQKKGERRYNRPASHSHRVEPRGIGGKEPQEGESETKNEKAMTEERWGGRGRSMLDRAPRSY